MKTTYLMLIPLLAGGLTMIEPAQAQLRDVSITVSQGWVSGPPGPRHAPPGHRSQPPRHAARHHRAVRHDPAREQARMASWYASTSVAQAREGWRFGCASNHPRWSTSYNEHYQWAYSAHPNQLVREVERRDVSLARCAPYYR